GGRAPGGRRRAPQQRRDRAGRSGVLVGPQARLVRRLWPEPGPARAAVWKRHPLPLSHRARAQLRSVGPEPRAARVLAGGPLASRRAEPSSLRSPSRPFRRRTAPAGSDAVLRGPAPGYRARRAAGALRRFQPVVAPARAQPDIAAPGTAPPRP